jgi:ATP-dependent RNA helicase DeaD
MLRGGDKRGELVRILEVENPESAIVFCNTKSETEVLAEALKRAGYEADWLNGDLEQSARERVMQATREGKLRFLVATDVAARGIDISHLTHVINADFPESAEAYVHRTGRTGRAGKTGTAISLVGPKDIGNLYILRLTYKIRPIERELPTKGELKTRAETDLVDMFVDAFASRAVDAEDASLARRLLTHPDAERMVAALLRDHLGARVALGDKDVAGEAAAARRGKNPPPIAAPPPPPNPAARETPKEQPKERPARTVSSSAPPPTRAEGRREPPRERTREPRRGGVPHKSYATWEPPEEADDDKPLLASEASPPPLPGYRETDPRDERDDPSLAQIFVNVGRRDGVRASDLQKLLVDGAGLAPEEAGRIRIRDRNTFVSVKKAHLEKAIAALAGQVLGGRSLIAEPAKPRAS